MKRFEGVMICTDLDGTLYKNDKTVSSENREAIAYFQREGGLFTFVTGRMPYFAESVYREVKPNAPVGCMNGGVIYDYRRHAYVWRRELAREALDLLESVLDAVPGIGVQINTFERVCFCRDNRANEDFRRVTGVENVHAEPREITEPIAKIVFADERENAILAADAHLRAHPLADRFHFVHSEKTLYEILPKGVNKGSGLGQLAAHLGIDMTRTVAVGDYHNDLEMIMAAGVGVAVGNAVPALKDAADFVTVSNEQHAIAAVIAELESGRLKNFFQ